MYCLFHDNSFGEGVFALFRDEEVLEERFLGQLETRQPVCVFQDLLTKRNLSLDDIDYVACGVGPGSYTGIRSACAAMRGISFCKNLGIVAIPSLLLYAPEEAGKYIIVVEGGMCGLYCQRVCFDGVKYEYEEPIILQVEEIEAFSRQDIYPNKLKNREFSDVERHRFDSEKSGPLFDIGADFSESKMGCSTSEKTDSSTCLGIVSPSASLLMQKGIVAKEVFKQVNGVARISSECYKKGAVYDALTLKLVYLRKTQAEIEKMKKSSRKEVD